MFALTAGTIPSKIWTSGIFGVNHGSGAAPGPQRSPTVPEGKMPKVTPALVIPLLVHNDPDSSDLTSYLGDPQSMEL